MRSPKSTAIPTESKNLKCHPENPHAWGSADGVSGVSRAKDLLFGRFTRIPSLWLKSAQALLLAVAVCFSLGATDAASRYNNLSHRTMCTCGCAEILGECNHVGCSASTEELAMIRDGMSSGQSDQQILDAMVARYGAVVLAAPTTHGFNLVAWIAPFAVLAAGILGVVLLVKNWTVGRTPAPIESTDPSLDPIREKIRRETEASDL